MDKPARRIALVCGGGGGIGSAISEKLAEEGNIVYIGYCRRKENAELAAAKSGSNARIIRLDLGDSAGINKVCEDIFNLEKRLDILVNCAAVNSEASAIGMDDETWGKVLEINLNGSFRLCRAVSKFMLLNKWGRIINMSSISASHGGRGQINYSTSKAGIEAMTRVLALELGRKGILVNCIAPGIVETEMSGRIRSEHGDRLLENIAVHRFGKPEEIADLAAFLVSESCSYVTGQVIRIDGGMAL
ncbi:MAG: SDR family NAD(P)-dependent oxidoreductase [Victivallales bacterium]